MLNLWLAWWELLDRWYFWSVGCILPCGLIPHCLPTPPLLQLCHRYIYLQHCWCILCHHQQSQFVVCCMAVSITWGGVQLGIIHRKFIVTSKAFFAANWTSIFPETPNQNSSSPPQLRKSTSNKLESCPPHPPFLVILAERPRLKRVLYLVIF